MRRTHKTANRNAARRPELKKQPATENRSAGCFFQDGARRKSSLHLFYQSSSSSSSLSSRGGSRKAFFTFMSALQ